jgi:hypothetical protein
MWTNLHLSAIGCNVGLKGVAEDKDASSAPFWTTCCLQLLRLPRLAPPPSPLINHTPPAGCSRQLHMSGLA